MAVGLVKNNMTSLRISNRCGNLLVGGASSPVGMVVVVTFWELVEPPFCVWSEFFGENKSCGDEPPGSSVVEALCVKLNLML